MNLAFPRLSKLAATETLAPDFAVLLTWLSAHQSASVTARHQILLDRAQGSAAEDGAQQIGVFTAGSSGAAAAASSGSFSDNVAKALTINSGR